MNVSEYFEKHVKGKRVAFVGLAPNIAGKGLGSEINSFDVVIRSNIFPVPENMQKDYGKKCDIICVNDKYSGENYSGVSRIITYHKVKKKQKDIDYLLVDKSERIRVRDIVKKETGINPIYGTQGVNIMQFCLDNGAAEFKFFGITGYQNKSGVVVDHGEAKHYILKDECRDKVSMRNHPTHDFGVLNDYLRILLKRGLIKMDKYSLEYFTNG